MFLNHILWFSKRFQVNVYIVMFKNVLLTFSRQRFLRKTFIKEARFDLKRFKNIYKIAEEMKVLLEMFLKHLS